MRKFEELEGNGLLADMANIRWSLTGDLVTRSDAISEDSPDSGLGFFSVDDADEPTSVVVAEPARPRKLV